MNDFDDLDSVAKAVNGEQSNYNNSNQNQGGSYADEVFSEKLVAQNRIFYIDVKESYNGRFLKISEKSRGQRSTIMMDQEDVEGFIEVLKKAQSKF